MYTIYGVTTIFIICIICMQQYITNIECIHIYLGPLFYIIYNDMPTILKDTINVNLNLYADDISLIIYAGNIELLKKNYNFILIN